MASNIHTPFVSVWMLAYNHEPYIAQAIEGVLMQKTKFKVLLHIGEDCSTDRTRDICIEYKEKYPEKIDLFLNEKNDIVKNARHTYEACFNSGAKYIALCEGDDYWTDPYKLQKQVDFLEGNPGYVICSHGHVNIDRHGNRQSERKIGRKTVSITINDLAQGFYVQTLTSLFRNRTEILKDFTEELIGSPMGDFTLFMLLAQKGKIALLPDIMAVRRVHPGGVYSSKSRIERNKGFVKSTKIVDDYYKGRYKKDLYAGRTNALYSVFLGEVKSKHKISAFKRALVLLYRYVIIKYIYNIHPIRFFKPKDLFYWLKKLI